MTGLRKGRICVMAGCNTPIIDRTQSKVCKAHRRSGGNAPDPIALRMARHTAVDDATGCHIWTGARKPKGYGRIRGPSGRMTVAHRVAYELAKGPIPAGLQLDHLCRNPSCVNPEHLEPVTARENILRGNSPAAILARKTHCPLGHELTPENTRIVRGERRQCVTCHPAAEPVKAKPRPAPEPNPHSANAAKTHCPNGHAYTAENTLYRGTWRYCRICRRNRKRGGAPL